jgi:hypothetical protein
MLEKAAIIAGVIITTGVVLIGQLIFILVASAIGNLDDSYTFFNTYKQEVWYAMGFMTHVTTMMAGGAVTAFFAYDNAAVNAAIVGALASCLSLVMSLMDSVLTWMSFFMVVLGMGFAVLGAMAWNRWSSSLADKEVA